MKLLIQKLHHTKQQIITYLKRRPRELFDYYQAWRNRATVREQGIMWTAICLLLFLYVGVLVVVYVTHINPPHIPSAHIEDEEASYRYLFEEIDLTARSVLVYDHSQDRIVFENNSTEIVGIASITKIMTALVALAEGDMNMPIVITRDALDMPGDHGLLMGDVWNLDDLIAFMMITSSNDAAYAIAAGMYPDLDPMASRLRFIEAMNNSARDRGLDDILFYNESGLDDEGNIQTFGSAENVMRLAYEAISTYPEIFEITTQRQEIFYSRGGFEHIAENTNRAIDRIPSYVFSKTGYTDGSGGSLVYIFERSPGDLVSVIILNSTFFGRFRDAEIIAHHVFHRLYNFDNE